MGLKKVPYKVKQANKEAAARIAKNAKDVEDARSMLRNLRNMLNVAVRKGDRTAMNCVCFGCSEAIKKVNGVDDELAKRLVDYGLCLLREAQQCRDSPRGS